MAKISGRQRSTLSIIFAHLNKGQLRSERGRSGQGQQGQQTAWSRPQACEPDSSGTGKKKNANTWGVSEIFLAGNWRSQVKLTGGIPPYLKICSGDKCCHAQSYQCSELPPNQGFQQARFNRAQKHRAMHATHYGAGLVVLQVVYADYHLIRGAVFSLTIPCPMNGLVTSRSALHLKLVKSFSVEH